MKAAERASPAQVARLLGSQRLRSSILRCDYCLARRDMRRRTAERLSQSPTDPGAWPPWHHEVNVLLRRLLPQPYPGPDPRSEDGDYESVAVRLAQEHGHDPGLALARVAHVPGGYTAGGVWVSASFDGLFWDAVRARLQAWAVT